MTTSEQWKELESKYYMFLVRRQPMVLERGEGARVWDVDGKEYLDFTSGWAVNNVGHCNEEVAKAISEQARTLVQTSNQFYSIPQLKMAQILIDNSCLDKIFICNSGAEANEGAIKLAKKYGKKNKDGAYEIITALSLPAWPASRRWAFIEFARRRGDFALAGIALYYDLDLKGRAVNAHIGAIGASDRPRRLNVAEQIVDGSSIDAEVIEAAAIAASEAFEPLETHHAPADYRRAILATLVERALLQASR